MDAWIQTRILSVRKPLTSESFIDLYGPKYLFLVVDDTNASSQNGFLSFYLNHELTKIFWQEYVWNVLK